MSAVQKSFQSDVCSPNIPVVQTGVIVFNDLQSKLIGIVTGHLLLIPKIGFKSLFTATLQEKHTYKYQAPVLLRYYQLQEWETLVAASVEKMGTLLGL